MKPTYRIAMAAGQDAGNRLMRELGLIAWDRACRDKAVDVFHELWTFTDEYKLLKS